MNDHVSGVVLKQLQEKMLKDFVVDVKEEKEEVVPPTPQVKHGLIVSCDPRKTLVMRQIENRFMLPMEKLLGTERRGSDIARHLGVSVSTVSKWRKKLRIRE